MFIVPRFPQLALWGTIAADTSKPAAQRAALTTCSFPSILSHACRPARLNGQQAPFHRQSAGEAAQCACRADDTVTGDDDRDGIGAQRLSNRPCGLRPADILRDPSIGPRLAGRYLCRRSPDRLLEDRVMTQVKGQIEPHPCAGKSAPYQSCGPGREPCCSCRDRSRTLFSGPCAPDIPLYRQSALPRQDDPGDASAGRNHTGPTEGRGKYPPRCGFHSSLRSLPDRRPSVGPGSTGT